MNVCPGCGTWECASCGWKRKYANRQSDDPQDCARCGSTEGRMLPTRHRGHRAQSHLEDMEVA